MIVKENISEEFSVGVQSVFSINSVHLHFVSLVCGGSSGM